MYGIKKVCTQSRCNYYVHSPRAVALCTKVDQTSLITEDPSKFGGPAQNGSKLKCAMYVEWPVPAYRRANQERRNPSLSPLGYGGLRWMPPPIQAIPGGLFPRIAANCANLTPKGAFEPLFDSRCV